MSLIIRYDCLKKMLLLISSQDWITLEKQFVGLFALILREVVIFKFSFVFWYDYVKVHYNLGGSYGFLDFHKKR